MLNKKKENKMILDIIGFAFFVIVMWEFFKEVVSEIG